MKKYKHVLLALELETEADQQLIKKSQQLIDQFKSKLTLIHAIEHLSNYGAAYGVAAGIDIEEVLQKEAQESMTKVGKALNVPADQQIVKIGPAKQLILDEAKKHNADLIIVGSHGRHGVRLLLGSTANAVLHGAECDVLAVRVRD